MGALRRILLALLGFVSLGLAALVSVALIDHNFAAALVADLDQVFLRTVEACFVEGRNLWLPLLIAALALVFGILLLIVAFYLRRPIRHVTVETLDGGAVHVNLHAIDTVVRRAAAQVPGVGNVANHLRVGKAGLHIRLSFSLPLERNVGEVGIALRQEINAQLEQMIGVRPAEIEISVMNINDKPSGRQSNAAAASAPEAVLPVEPVEEV